MSDESKMHPLEISISVEEWRLLNSGLLPKALQVVVDRAEPRPHGRYRLAVPTGQIEEFRSALSLALARTGFDERYRLTVEGRLLEDLIDRLFVL